MRTQTSDIDPREKMPRLASESAAELDLLVHHRSRSVLEALLDRRDLGERHLHALLSRRDLPQEIISRIARNRDWMTSYRTKLAVVQHPRTPRAVALPLLKFIYLFDLLGLALSAGVPAELKRLAEDAILAQSEGIPLGQRISLARRGSHRLAGRLLGDADRRVIEAALSNPFLTEHSVSAALLLENASAELAEAVMNHPRWSIPHVVKLALVRCKNLSLGRLLGLLPELTTRELAEVASDRRVASNIRAYAARTFQARSRQQNFSARNLIRDSRF
jgi:hypothetical protein